MFEKVISGIVDKGKTKVTCLLTWIICHSEDLYFLYLKIKKVFKPRYGSSIMTISATLNGHPLGVVANIKQVMCSKGMRKTTQFIQLCGRVRK